MAVSTPDRHLVFIGTETTIGSPGTQDDMFVRFSDQESINATEFHGSKGQSCIIAGFLVKYRCGRKGSLSCV